MKFVHSAVIAAASIGFLAMTSVDDAAAAQKACSYDACFKSCMSRGGGSNASSQSAHCSRGCSKKVCKNGALAS